MELWIRSQDREELVKVDNIRVKHEYEQKKVNDNYGRTCAYVKGNYRCSYIYADSTWLGEYKSKERALEVLDEIQDMIKPTLINTEYHSEIKQGINNLEFDVVMKPVEDKIQYIQPNVVVYEMPQE